MKDTEAGADPVVRIASGAVRGQALGGVHRFLSIPYAAPPIGELRFRAPQPHAPWEGVREAWTPGPAAPQHVAARSGLDMLDLTPLMGANEAEGDEFLALNIWAPDPAPSGAPVMVWVHGGAFLLGSKDAPLYDGSAFARSGVVLVSLNYRMGLEGFVHVPGGDSNVGLRDQLAALRWVGENIAAFGGDPANVTVFGESAGAMSIANLVTSPLAKGLFRRAIVQSGHGGMVRSIAIAERLTRLLARRLNVSPDAYGFRSRAVDDGLKAVAWASQPTVRLNLRDGSGREPTAGVSRFLPVFGDEVLPQPPLEALKRGAGADVDLLIGTNRDEMNLYFVPSGMRDKIGGLMARFFMSRIQPKSGALLKAYGLGRAGRKPGAVLTEALSDLVFRWPARRFAEEHQGRTHVYEFDWRSDACNGELGACHGLELPFVFGTLAVTSGEKGLAGRNPPLALSDRVHKIWVDFARDGSLPWPEYGRDDRQVYSVTEAVSLPEAPAPAAAFLP